MFTKGGEREGRNNRKSKPLIALNFGSLSIPSRGSIPNPRTLALLFENIHVSSTREKPKCGFWNVSANQLPLP
jgi:hypothetical protein